MKQRVYAVAAAIAIFGVLPMQRALSQEGLDTARIEQETALKGTFNREEGVFKVTLPRKDIQPTVAGIHIVPDQGLGAWAAFTRVGNHAMVMGDIVMRESEVNAVMSAALENGLQVTALHNHFMWDTPKVMFMHIGGMGDEAELSRAVGKVFATLREVIRTPPAPPDVAIDPSKSALHGGELDAIIGHHGSVNQGVYKVVIGRKASMADHAVGKEMGVNTWAVFAGTSDAAVVDGDFCMQEAEVQGVLKALRGGGISIVAIHNHMIGESPRYVFLHYWGVGKPEKLAHAFRAALDTQER